MSELPSHSGLFKVIREDHGVEVLKSVRHYVNTACKLSRTQQHIAFSQRCCRYQVPPRSLVVKTLVSTSQDHQIVRKVGYQFLTAHVQHCYNKLKHLETDLYFQGCQLQNSGLKCVDHPAASMIDSPYVSYHSLSFNRLND